MDLVQLAQATAFSLAPFLPYLVEPAKTVGGAFVEKLGELGGEAAWSKAQELWGALTKPGGASKEVRDAAKLVAKDPDNDNGITALVDALAARLRDEAVLAETLTRSHGGAEAVQEVIARHEARISNVEQISERRGKQRVVAGGKAQIKGVKQRIGGPTNTEKK